MIYYFSGTGNSRYVAKSLADMLGEEMVSIPEADIYSIRKSWKEGAIGLVFPVYSWGVPPIVLQFVDEIGKVSREFKNEVDNRPAVIWAVMTCGDETAMAPEMLRKRAMSNSLTISGIWSVQMPNNYVLLPGFSVDPKNIEKEKLEKAPERIAQIAGHIRRKEWVTDVVRGSWPRLKTGFVYPLFKRWGIFPKKWESSSECIGCGRCARVCPVGNIEMKDGHPQWGERCVSCVACYHSCPVRAIDYGKLTKGKGQYFFGKK